MRGKVTSLCWWCCSTPRLDEHPRGPRRGAGAIRFESRRLAFGNRGALPRVAGQTCRPNRLEWRKTIDTDSCSGCRIRNRRRRNLHCSPRRHVERNRSPLSRLARADCEGQRVRSGKGTADRDPTAYTDGLSGAARSGPSRRAQPVPVSPSWLRHQLPQLRVSAAGYAVVCGHRAQRRAFLHNNCAVLRRRVGRRRAAPEHLHQHRLQPDPRPSRHTRLRGRRKREGVQALTAAGIRRRL